MASDKNTLRPDVRRHRGRCEKHGFDKSSGETWKNACRYAAGCRWRLRRYGYSRLTSAARRADESRRDQKRRILASLKMSYPPNMSSAPSPVSITLQPLSRATTAAKKYSRAKEPKIGRAHV